MLLGAYLSLLNVSVAISHAVQSEVSVYMPDNAQALYCQHAIAKIVDKDDVMLHGKPSMALVTK